MSSQPPRLPPKKSSQPPRLPPKKIPQGPVPPPKPARPPAASSRPELETRNLTSSAPVSPNCASPVGSPKSKQIVKVLLGDVQEETVVTISIPPNCSTQDVCVKLLSKAWVADKLGVKGVDVEVASRGFGIILEKDADYLPLTAELPPGNRHVMRRRGSPPRTFAADLWDGIDGVSKRSDEGITFAKDMKSFFASVSSAHLEYHKSITKACKAARASKSLNAPEEVGSCRDFHEGFRVAVNAMESVASSSLHAADAISGNVAKTMENLVKILQQQHKSLVADFNYSLKHLQNVRLQLEHSHKEYCSLSKSAHNDTQAAEMAVGDAKTKASIKADQARDKAKSGEAAYQSTLYDYNVQLEEHNSKTTTAVLEAFEVADTWRLNEFKAAISKAAAALRPVADSVNKSVDMICKSTDSLLPIYDTQIFIAAHTTGDHPPAPLKFFPWKYNPETDKANQSKASKLATKFRSVRGSKEKNSAKGGLLFGGSISDILAHDKEMGHPGEVPHVVTVLIDSILRLEGPQTQGIFRVPAPAAAVRELKALLEDGDFSVETPDVSIPAAALKLWFRELAEPLIPAKFYDRAVAIGRGDSKSAESQAAARALVLDLPPENQAIIAVLVEFFCILFIPDNIAETKMGLPNIAMVFAPSFLRTPDVSLIAVNMTAEARFVESYLEAACAALDGEAALTKALSRASWI